MRIFSYHGKHEKKKAARLPLSAYLTYLLVATLMFTGVSFSKFATTTSGSDSARVANFSVSAAIAEGQKTELDLDLSAASAEKTDQYVFTVDNASEVRVAYTVTVDLKNALPNGVTMAVTMDKGNGAESMETLSISSNVYTYSSELDFTDNHTWTLVFTGDPAEVTATTKIEDISVSVTAEQID